MLLVIFELLILRFKHINVQLINLTALHQVLVLFSIPERTHTPTFTEDGKIK